MAFFTVLASAFFFFATLANAQNTYTNPIIDGESSDPSIYRHNGFYYLTVSREGSSKLMIYKSADLTNFRGANETVAYEREADTSNIWASEMHHVHGELYLYFSMAKGGQTHKVFAIKADDPMDPMGKWGRPIRLMEWWNNDQVDGTVFEHGNGRRYMMWVSGEGGKDMSLWIAEMFGAVRVANKATQIRYAVSQWEMNGRRAILGPSFFHRNNITYLVFSASDVFNPDSCLGLMHIEGDGDPENPRDWGFGPDRPVFWKNEAENVYAPGHASVTISPDGTESWMVYHASSQADNIGPNRIARADKIEWDQHGRPVFPRPSSTAARPKPSANGPWWDGRGFVHDEVRMAAPASKTSDNGGLSGGAVAGIVIGVLAGVALLAGVGYYMMVKRGGGGGAAPSFGNSNYSSKTVIKTDIASSLDTHA